MAAIFFRRANGRCLRAILTLSRFRALVRWSFKHRGSKTLDTAAPGRAPTWHHGDMERDASQKKRATARARTRAQPATATEPREAALRGMAKREGNDGVKQALSSAESRRDALLAYIGNRLGAIRSAQQAETRAQAHTGAWVDQMARGAKGMALPDPSRWSAPAQAYRHAIEALASGDLARGTQLLERAHEMESRAFETLPAQVDLPESERDVAPLPDEARGSQGGEGCPRRAATELLAQADTIVRVSDDADAVSGRRMRQHRGWWDREPEEESTAKDDPKDKARAATPTTGTERATERAGSASERTRPERTPETQASDVAAKEQGRAPEREAPAKEAEDAGQDAAERVRSLARKKR